MSERDSKVTRFEVIDWRETLRGDEPQGRVYTARPCRIQLCYQDDGQTLKVFVMDEDRDA